MGIGSVPFFCFSRISAATASLSRCISLPLFEFPFFCRPGEVVSVERHSKERFEVVGGVPDWKGKVGNVGACAR